MRTLDTIAAELAGFTPRADARAAAEALLATAEEVLEHWIDARGEVPTREAREGFRVLALHRQGSQDLPSFNACRETCREIAYHYNLLHAQCDDALARQRQRMMVLLVNHLALFVTGKMQVDGLGEFCCASRPLRASA